MRRTVIEAGAHPLAMDDDFAAWLESYGLEPKNIYMVVLEDHWMTVFQYDTNEEGAKYVIPEGEPGEGSAATKEPVVVEYQDDKPFPKVVEEEVSGERRGL